MKINDWNFRAYHFLIPLTTNEGDEYGDNTKWDQYALRGQHGSQNHLFLIEFLYRYFLWNFPTENFSQKFSSFSQNLRVQTQTLSLVFFIFGQQQKKCFMTYWLMARALCCRKSKQAQKNWASFSYAHWRNDRWCDGNVSVNWQMSYQIIVCQ